MADTSATLPALKLAAVRQARDHGESPSLPLAGAGAIGHVGTEAPLSITWGGVGGSRDSTESACSPRCHLLSRAGPAHPHQNLSCENSCACWIQEHRDKKSKGQASPSCEATSEPRLRLPPLSAYSLDDAWVSWSTLRNHTFFIQE